MLECRPTVGLVGFAALPKGVPTPGKRWGVAGEGLRPCRDVRESVPRALLEG
jgi:hypothetical protein